MQTLSVVSRAVGGALRRQKWAVGACALLLLPALLDLPLLGSAAERLHHSIDAVFAVLGVFVVAGLVQRWTATRQIARDEARYRDIAMVVFRSLSQSVNDAYRTVAAPILGLSLRDSGIPGSDREGEAEERALVALAGLQPETQPASGFWHDQYTGVIAQRLRTLVAVDGFSDLMFRRTARARRTLQSAFTEAASTAIAVPRAAEELAAIAELANALVTSQEMWRTAALTGPIGAARADAAAECWRALEVTNKTLMLLQERADLPAGRVDVRRTDRPGG